MSHSYATKVETQWEYKNTTEIEITSAKRVNALELKIDCRVNIHRWTATIQENQWQTFEKKMQHNYAHPRIHSRRPFLATSHSSNTKNQDGNKDFPFTIKYMNEIMNSVQKNVHGECAFLPHPIYRLVEDVSENMNIIAFCAETTTNNETTNVELFIYRDFWSSNLFMQHAGDKLMKTMVDDWLHKLPNHK
jgi:hypothetical protein